MISKPRFVGPVALAFGLALVLPFALSSGTTPASAQAISCGKVLEWVAPKLLPSTADTWECPYGPNPDGTWNHHTCHTKAWNIPGYNRCKEGESELCKCCRICKIKATHVDVICNAAGCQPGNPSAPPLGTQEWYYPARLYFCTGEQEKCKDKTPHEKCLEFELPDDSQDCGW